MIAGDVVQLLFRIINDGNVALRGLQTAAANTDLTQVTCTPALGTDMVVGGTIECHGSRLVLQAELEAGSNSYSLVLQAANSATNDGNIPFVKQTMLLAVQLPGVPAVQVQLVDLGTCQKPFKARECAAAGLLSSLHQPESQASLCQGWTAAGRRAHH